MGTFGQTAGKDKKNASGHHAPGLEGKKGGSTGEPTGVGKQVSDQTEESRAIRSEIGELIKGADDPEPAQSAGSRGCRFGVLILKEGINRERIASIIGCSGCGFTISRVRSHFFPARPLHLSDHSLRGRLPVPILGHGHRNARPTVGRPAERAFGAHKPRGETVSVEKPDPEGGWGFGQRAGLIRAGFAEKDLIRVVSLGELSRI